MIIVRRGALQRQLIREPDALHTTLQVKLYLSIIGRPKCSNIFIVVDILILYRNSSKLFGILQYLYKYVIDSWSLIYSEFLMVIRYNW